MRFVPLFVCIALFFYWLAYNHAILSNWWYGAALFSFTFIAGMCMRGAK